MAEIRNPRWWPSAILELLHHHTVYISVSNFIQIRCIVLKIWRFNFLADLAWNAYSRPKNFGFWGLNPYTWLGYHQDPKRHIFDRNRSYMPILIQIGPLRETKESKKKEKRQGKKLTVANWVFAQTTHVDAAIILWSCMPGGLREIVLSFKFRQNWLNGFRYVGIEICHFLLLRPCILTACTTVGLQAVIIILSPYASAVTMALCSHTNSRWWIFAQYLLKN